MSPSFASLYDPLQMMKLIMGRFHFDFDQGIEWKKNINGTSDKPGIVLIHPGEFGLKGNVLKQLPLDAENAADYRQHAKGE